MSLCTVTLLLMAAAGHAVIGRDDYHSYLPRSPTSGGPQGADTATESDAAFWRERAQAWLQRRLKQQLSARAARNVIMFLGDGMSVPTLAAARTLLGQRNNRTGEETQLAFETFPTVGLSKTYCVDAQVADSACSATAYLCGVKANRGTLGVTAAVPHWDCSAAVDPRLQVDSIAAWALQDGKDAGLVTTTRVTHASPAGLFAHSAARDWESDADVAASCDTRLQADIAHQLIHSYPGNRFKVILGGGRREFLPSSVIDEEGTPGRRLDGRNLIEDWQTDKRARGASYKYVWNRTEVLSAMSTPPEYILGLFEDSHMQYAMQADAATEPTLAELTEIAIRSLRRNERGFFLFVEGGRIDHAHHDNYVQLALDETLQMDAAVARAAQLLSADDTLLVVTADHAHVMAFNGYSPRGTNILGASGDRGDDNTPYQTLSYTNGPGNRTHTGGVRPDVTTDANYLALRWRTHVDVPLASETHGGDDVAVFARGPHHELFTGLYEQSQLPHLMAYAACLGPGRHACTSAASPASPAGAALPMLLFTLLSLYRVLRH